MKANKTYKIKEGSEFAKALKEVLVLKKLKNVTKEKTDTR